MNAHDDELPEFPPGLLEGPVPESWPRYDEAETVAMLDELLSEHRFLRDQPSPLAVRATPAPPLSSSKADPPVWTPERLLVAWQRFREFPDDRQRAERGEIGYAVDQVAVWGDGRVSVAILDHCAEFHRWPAAWIRTAISAVLEHLGAGTGAG